MRPGLCSLTWGTVGTSYFRAQLALFCTDSIFSLFGLSNFCLLVLFSPLLLPCITVGNDICARVSHFSEVHFYDSYFFCVLCGDNAYSYNCYVLVAVEYLSSYLCQIWLTKVSQFVAFKFKQNFNLII